MSVPLIMIGVGGCCPEDESESNLLKSQSCIGRHTTQCESQQLSSLLLRLAKQNVICYLALPAQRFMIQLWTDNIPDYWQQWMASCEPQTEATAAHRMYEMLPLTAAGQGLYALMGNQPTTAPRPPAIRPWPSQLRYQKCSMSTS